MPRERETQRPIVTVDLGVEGKERLDALVEKRRNRYSVRTFNRSQVMREAVAMYFAWVLFGRLPTEEDRANLETFSRSLVTDFCWERPAEKEG